MAIEDQIRSSVDASVAQLTARVDSDVRAMVEQLITAAVSERDAAVSAAQEAAATAAALSTKQEVEAATADVKRQVQEAAAAETKRQVEAAEAAARVREREAEMAGVTRMLESVRLLDAAATLTDVLDALALGASREVSRAAVLVIRGDRLIGWKASGFGPRDAHPRSIDLGLSESGVTGLAAAGARSVSTREAGASAPGFAQLPAGRLGLAVPVNVGGRAVAVVYADGGPDEGSAHQTPSGWPEVIEILARHAARCLEALTAQKAVSAATPRFWMQAAAGRPGATA